MRAPLPSSAGAPRGCPSPQLDRGAGQEPASAPRRSGTLGRWSALPQPSKAPILLGRGSQAASCSCHGFLGSSRRLARLRARRHTQEPRRCGFPSRRRIPGTQDRDGRHPCARVPSRTRLAPRQPLWIFFSAPAEASYRSANGRFAHPHPREGEQELDPLGVGGPRPLLEVFGEKPHRLLVRLRSLAGGFPRPEGAALIGLLAIAFDRSAIYPEASGGLCLGHALLHRLYDLLSEVQRVRSHVSTILGASSSQPAVRTSKRPPTRPS